MPSRLRAGAGSGDVGDWVGVGVGVMTLFHLTAPIPRSVFGTLFSGSLWSSLRCWVDLFRRYVKGKSALLVSLVVVGKKPRL